MRTLILMRHAKSDWKQPGLADHDRPLNARGRKSAPLMAHKLTQEGVSVDIILASSAERVQETLVLMRPIWAQNVKVLTEKSLYLAGPSQIAEQLNALNDTWKSVMIVGHNPGMVSLVCHLAKTSLEMPTAAVAIFQSEIDSWVRAIDSPWRLTAHWKPRDLDADE